MGILLIFIDGIGIGEHNPDINPLARFQSPYLSHFKTCFQKLPYHGIVVETDPTMGFAGLPQSATGQTALFTGENAAKILGRHLSGYPSPTLRALLKQESIFLKLEKSGKTATFANAFTPEYLDRPARRISASTWAARAASFPLRMVNSELQEGTAVMHDITNAFLHNNGYEIILRTPEEAAKNLADLADDFDFCLFEYFLTDVIGHRCDWQAAQETIAKLDAFLGTLLGAFDLQQQSIVVTSDHGNFEDLTTPVHTLNNIATQIWGPARSQLATRVRSIEDITPAILSCLISH